MPINLASSTACSTSPCATLGLLAVTATALAPNANWAALATTALSTPPEKATAQLSNSANRFSKALCLANSSGWVGVLFMGKKFSVVSFQ